MPARSNLQKGYYVQREQDGEEDRPSVQVSLDERAATERARAGSHSEGSGEPRILAGVHQDQHDHEDREDDLDAAEDRFHPKKASGPCRPGAAGPRGGPARAGSRSPRRAGRDPRLASRRVRACPSGGPARRRGSRGTWPPSPPSAPRGASPRGAPPLRGGGAAARAPRRRSPRAPAGRVRTPRASTRARALGPGGRSRASAPGGAAPRATATPPPARPAPRSRRRSRSTRRAATRSPGTPPAADRAGSG